MKITYRCIIGLCFFIIILLNPVFAATPKKNIFQLKQMPTQYNISFDSVRMPDGKKNMGLLGVSYRILPISWIYTGISGFGAVRGENGGLFVLGLTVGVQAPLISNKLYGDLGFDAGGGGGHRSEVGNGLMIRPHVGLFYNFGSFRLGAIYSKVKFPSGKIDSNQIGVAVDIPSSIDYSDPEYSGTVITTLERLNYKKLGSLFFQRMYLAPLLQTYFQAKGTKDTSGNVADGNISQVGVELGRYLNFMDMTNTFIFIKAGGAFRGDHNGYMDVLGGVGYRYQLFRQLFATGRLALGAGGGGDVDTGGGFLTEPSLGLQLQLTQHFSTELDGGYLYAPSGDFKAVTATLKLIYSMSIADTTKKPMFIDTDLFSDKYIFHLWRIRVANQTYIHAQRKWSADRSTNLVEFKVDTYLNHYLYITGQAGSAYSDNAGGYSTGMLGAGITSPKFFYNRIDSGIELLAGAGGGGGLDVGGGLLLQPKLMAECFLTNYLSINAELGRVYAPRGKLNATTVDLGIAFHFTTLKEE